ncbi:MAG: RodZ domain-containing protein [Pseudomonadota bacterium]
MARKNNDTVAVKQPQEQVSSNLDIAIDDMSYSRSRCGGALRVAREKQGLSLHDVASKLKISNKQIEAIEADHFAALPESTIVRGFIRNYAKLLKIDVEPLLDAYNVLVPNKEPLAFTIKPSSNMKVGEYKKPKLGQYLVLITLLILAFAAWFLYQQYIQKPSPTAPIGGIENLEPLPEQALPAAERLESSTELALPPAVSGDVLPTQPELTPNTSATPDAQLTVDPVAAVIDAPALDNSVIRLEIAASQETWVSIVDAQGKETYNKIIFAGSRETIETKSPSELVVGNAIGTNLMVNGKSVDLAPHTRVNVARLKLE